MKRALIVLAALLALAPAVGVGSASAAASERASCNGLGVSTLAGQPGAVSATTLNVHGYVREVLGLPPGTFDSFYAQLHEGSVEGCFGSA